MFSKNQERLHKETVVVRAERTVGKQDMHSDSVLLSHAGNERAALRRGRCRAYEKRIEPLWANSSHQNELCQAFCASLIKL